MQVPRQKKPPDTIGWREYVGLPDLGIEVLKAKIDTGARTAALHTTDVEPLERDGQEWVSFCVPRSGQRVSTRYLAPIYDRRAVKNTSGVAEDRYIIHTTLLLGHHRWHIQVSLANRENMGFDLILGRTALKGRRVLINPGRSFLVGLPAPHPTHRDGGDVANASDIVVCEEKVL